MKTVIISLLLAAVFGTSFMPAAEEAVSASFRATVDGKAFELGQDQLLKGIVVSRSGSMDGKIPARNVVTATFNGTTFSDKIQLEIDYPVRTGYTGAYGVILLHQSFNYSVVKEQSRWNITAITWEEDKKHFALTADFECKMRSYGYPADGLKDITLKGKLTNVRITVPSTIALR